MNNRSFAIVAGLCASGLGSCAPALAPTAATAPIEVQILAFNDFHGNLEPPGLPIHAAGSGGAGTDISAGGVVRLAGTLADLRRGRPYTITVSAGDLIGASPLISALFLDEPTITAMNMAGLSLNAVGNHEFDKGEDELLRMQRGGCATFTRRKPCALEPFGGARFEFLAANVLTEQGKTLFPATAIRRFGPITIGFIGMTLKATSQSVTPSGVAGLSFLDEAGTANALVPGLRRQGADTIVLLIHQGGATTGNFDDPACPGLSGEILPILARLDPAIAVVVSGHTHNAYRCRVPIPGQGRTRLLTSAGKYGTLVSDIRLRFSRPTRELIDDQASFAVVGGNPPQSRVDDLKVAALVERYRRAATPLADRTVGHIAGPISATPDAAGGQRLGEMIADAQREWTRPGSRGGAQIAFMNSGGVRTDLVPLAGGRVTYGQLFALQPFGNGLVVQTLSGRQLKRLLEQQFGGPDGRPTPDRYMLLPSAGFVFAYDLTRVPGDRVVAMTLAGRPIDPGASYRIATNSFLASGGDGFTVLREGTDRRDAGEDLAALEAYIGHHSSVPVEERIKKMGHPTLSRSESRLSPVRLGQSSPHAPR